MMWDLPTSVIIDGEKHKIKGDCDYRVVLDCMAVYEDVDIEPYLQHLVSLQYFYENPDRITNTEEAIRQMVRVMNCKREDEEAQTKNNQQSGERLMSWTHDFALIAPPVSRVLGYDVRTPSKYTHWWTFTGAFTETGGDCYWAAIISIREKLQNGTKLEPAERKFYEKHKKDIILPIALTEEEREWLNSED